jgi:hypothetical protein
VPRPLAALALLLASAGAAQAQTPAVSFGPLATYGTGSTTGPRDLAVADVNGDGRPDLLAANGGNMTSSAGNTAGVLLGTSTGIFGPAATYATGISSGPNSNPVDIAVADMNGDGYPDLLTANFSSNSNSVGVLLGNGNGTFRPAANYGSGITNPSRVAVGDLTGDGKLDLLLTNSSLSWAGVLRGNGDGTFQTATTFWLNGNSRPAGIALADVNGDGKLDLLTADNFTHQVGVMLGFGNGTFQSATTYPSGGLNPNSVAAADVNGDGYLDLLVANGRGDTLGVLLGNGDGTFQATTSYSSGGSTPSGIAVADVNGDGQPDLLTANFNSNNASVLLGNGTGTFQPAVTFSTGTGRPSDLIAADVNGDGKPDLLAVNTDNNTAVVLRNTSGFTAPTLTGATPARAPAGTSVTLTGTNLAGATSVSFNGTPATTFSVVNSTTITATVPSGATNGPVTVTGPGGTGGGLAFVVQVAPAVTTLVSGVANTSAVLGGTVAADGGAAIIDRGVVYSSTTTAPIIGGAGVMQDANGAGQGSFSKTIAGLAPGTTYTARAYATNGIDTGYGAAVSFTPQPATSVVAISQADGNPINAGSVRFTVTFAAPVTGVSSSNFALVATTYQGFNSVNSITSVSGAGTTYTVTVSVGSNTATLGLNLVNDTNLSPGLTTALPLAGPVYTLDRISPVVTISSPIANGGNTITSPIVFSITYNEPTTYLNAITLANVTNAGPASTIASNGTGGLVLTIVPAAAGPVTVTVPASTVADAAGNPNYNAPSYTVNYGTVTAAPVVTTPANNATLTSPPTYAGTAPTGSTVTLYLALGSGAAQVIGTTTATGGAFRFAPGTALAPGTYAVYATAQLSGQAVSANSNVVTFTIPTATAPLISNLSPATGPVGTQVLIFGTNLSGATAVRFNGTAASSFVVNSANSITAVVAAGTTTGPVQVTTPSGTATSSVPFVVRVAPTTVAESYTTPADITLTGNVLTNDIGTNPRAILILYPTHGTLILNPTGTFTYRANAGYSGPDSFYYYACDQSTPLLCGNPVTVNITVTPGRVAPTTVADSYTTPQGVVLTGNVLTNDLGTNPRAILIIRPTRGVFVLNPNGTFTYQPSASFVGSDSFIYYACDPAEPLLCGNPVTVNITVLPAGSSARGAAPATGTPAAKPAGGAAGGATGALELTLSGHPNPFADELQLSFALPIAQAYTLALYDAQGRLVRQLSSGQAEAGQAQELAVPTQSYAAGLYLVRLSTDSGTRLLKLLKQ